MPWDVLGPWLDRLVDLTLLLGALAAAYKFRVFDVLGHKFRSEVWCTSGKIGADQKTLFVGQYVIHNTGNRPMKISWVTLSLLRPRLEGDARIIDSDQADEIVTREFGSDTGVSWFKVGAGERSIFPLRCVLDEFPAPVLMRCRFRWKHGGQPSEFVWLYDPRLPATWWSEPTPGLPAEWDPGSGVHRVDPTPVKGL
jgi:hypothetical protein